MWAPGISLCYSEFSHIHLWPKIYCRIWPKPLGISHVKNLVAASTHLQRMVLKLQPYILKIKYRPGKEMFLTDTLLRLPFRTTQDFIPLDLQVHHNSLKQQKNRSHQSSNIEKSYPVHCIPPYSQLMAIHMQWYPHGSRMLLGNVWWA